MFKGVYRVQTARAHWHHYQFGLFFVTINTIRPAMPFGVVEINPKGVPGVALNELGRLAAKNLMDIPNHTTFAHIADAIVMPNHIHALVQLFHTTIEKSKGISPISHSLANVIRTYKASVTRDAKRIGVDFAWQTRYHDVIVRDPSEADSFAQYIKNNPKRWYERMHNM